ncbi:MAG: hypothetical protein WCO30_00825 [bacterium]
MITKKGNTRFVLVFPKLGFVVKFPIVRISALWPAIINPWKYGWETESLIWKAPVSCFFSYKYLFFSGIVANWLEWRFWRRYKHPFIHPTWFSFFGLFNIQKYGKPINNDCYFAIGSSVAKTTNGASIECGHGLESSGNYCEVNGTIRLVDYGSVRTWRVIIRHGHKLMKLRVSECLIKY